MPTVPSLFHANSSGRSDFDITYSNDQSSFFSKVADSNEYLFPEINELNNFAINLAPFRTYNGMTDRFGLINSTGTDRRLYYNENPSLLPKNSSDTNYVYCYFYFKTRGLWKGFRFCIPYSNSITFTGYGSNHAAYLNLIREMLLANKAGWVNKNLFESTGSCPCFISKDGAAMLLVTSATRTSLQTHAGLNVLSVSTAELRPERVVKFKYTKNTARMLRVLAKNVRPFALDPIANKQIPEIGRVLVPRPDLTLIQRMNQAQVYGINNHTGTSVYTLRKGTRNNLFRLTLQQNGEVHSEELCTGKLSELRREAREAYTILSLKPLFRPKSYLGEPLLEVFDKYNENLISTRDRLLASFDRAVKFDLKRLIRLQPPDTKWLIEAGYKVQLRGNDLLLTMPIESHWYNNNFHITYKKPKTFQWTIANYMGGPVTRFNFNASNTSKIFSIHSSGQNFCTGSGNVFVDEIAAAINDKDAQKIREFTHLLLNDVNNESPLDSSSAALRDCLADSIAAFRVRRQENSEFVDMPLAEISLGSFQSMISSYHDRSRGRAPRHINPEDFVKYCYAKDTATYKKFFPPVVVEPPPVSAPSPDTQLSTGLGSGQIHVYGIVGNNLAANYLADNSQEPTPYSIAFDPREHHF